ncbi:MULTISPECIES: tRNA lysidine(34) synthetase TilS [Bartonella]|uniref:tRNA lysidine(34) synthetase TilS n=1 Tax=Bartonella TaxID=773 RepID=UPI001FE490FA|nr:tRNA lysidine(34) synthetase TilS [Bartonella capreoli]
MLIQLAEIFKKSDFTHCQKLIVAASGGGDSLALLFLLKDYFKTLLSPPEIIVVTVDHQLREESACEAQKVAEICRAYQIKHVIVRWEGTKPKTDISQKARVARYDLLFQEAEKQGATLIMTGHTLNDQVETYYMRCQRVLKDKAVSQQGGWGDEVFALRSKGEGGVGVEQGNEAAGARCGVEAAGISQQGGWGDEVFVLGSEGGGGVGVEQGDEAAGVRCGVEAAGVSQQGGRGDEVFALRSEGEGFVGVEQGDEAAGVRCGVEAAGVSQQGGRGDEVFALRSKGEGFVGVEQGNEAAGAQCGVEAVGVSQQGGRGDYNNTWEEMGVTGPLKDASVLKDNGELIERGLSCIAREALLRRKVRLIRPLLGIKRDTLRAYLRLRGIEWIDDPTNDDLRFERVRVRHSIHFKDFSEVAQKVNEAALKRRQYAQMIADLILALDIVVKYGRCFIKRPEPFLCRHPGFPFVVGLFAVLMGGSPYLLASQKLSALNQKLCLHSLEKKRFTLAGSLVEYSQKGIAFWREARNIQEAIILPGQTFLWDGRYQITNHERDALKVRAADLVHLKQFFRYGKYFSNTHIIGEGEVIGDMVDFEAMVDRKRPHFPSLQSLPLVLGAKGIDIPELSHLSCCHKVTVQRILAPFNWLSLHEDAALINVVEPFFNIT